MDTVCVSARPFFSCASRVSGKKEGCWSVTRNKIWSTRNESVLIVKTKIKTAGDWTSANVSVGGGGGFYKKKDRIFFSRPCSYVCKKNYVNRLGSQSNAVVWALASHHCGRPGLILGPGVVCWLSLLREVFSGFSGFLLSRKLNNLNSDLISCTYTL